MDLIFFELFANIGFTSQQANDALTGFVLNFRRNRRVEGIRKGNEQKIADLPHGQNHVLLAEFEIDFLKRCRMHAVTRATL